MEGLIRMLQFAMTPPSEPGVGKGLLEKAATTKRTGVVGFESPGLGSGYTQRDLIDAPTIVYNENGVPYYVTYKWLQEICELSEEVNKFYHEIWNVYEKKSESIFMDAPAIVMILSDDWEQIIPEDVRLMTDNGYDWICKMLEKHGSSPALVQDIIQKIASQDLENICKCVETDYTYNDPDNCGLTQDIQFSHRDGWAGIIFHTGVDAKQYLASLNSENCWKPKLSYDSMVISSRALREI